MTDYPSDAILGRYFTGELSPEESTELQRWLAEDSANEAHAESLRDLWTRAGQMPSDREMEVAWRDVSARLRLNENGDRRSVKLLPLAQPKRYAKRRYFAWTLGALAAAAAVFAAVRVEGARTRPTPVVVYREYATKNAQRANVRLPDGSRVVLAPASRLLVPDNYGVQNRALQLEGEAYFDVVHNDAKAFTVRTKNTMTRDIGTAFVVTDYASERSAHVLVAEGEVAVLSARDTTAGTLQLLKRGDFARVSTNGAVTRSRVANVSRRLAWLDGGLAFDDVPLSEAAREIGRWYDLDIRVPDSTLARRPLIATIGDQAPDEVVQLLALTLKMRFVREGRTVTFYSK